jgi:hypothetical protein
MNKQKNGHWEWITSLIILLILGSILAWNSYHKKKDNNTSSVPQQQVAALRTEPIVFEPHEAWYKNKKVTFYDFGPSSPAIGSLYTLITGYSDDGTPKVVDGQGDIFSTKRGDPTYSDFWELKLVTVPADYIPNSVKTAQEIADKKYDVKATGILVDQPQVLELDTISPNMDKLVGWANGEKVYSWRVAGDFVRDPNNPNNILVSNVYTIISGYDKNNIPLPIAGQQNIVDTTPGDENESPLKLLSFVKAATDYKPQTIQSADEIKLTGYETKSSGAYVNAPIYSIDGKVIAGFKQADENDVATNQTTNNNTTNLFQSVYPTQVYQIQPQVMGDFGAMSSEGADQQQYPSQNEQSAEPTPQPVPQPVPTPVPANGGVVPVDGGCLIDGQPSSIRITINGQTYCPQGSTVFRGNDVKIRVKERIRTNYLDSELDDPNFPFN